MGGSDEKATSEKTGELVRHSWGGGPTHCQPGSGRAHRGWGGAAEGLVEVLGLNTGKALHPHQKALQPHLDGARLVQGAALVLTRAGFQY